MVSYGLVTIATNHLIDATIMKCISGSVCLKLLGSSGEHLDSTAKKLKHNTSCVGGALSGTVNEYHLNLEDEQQDASNVLDVLKESTYRMENRISEEVAKKRAVNFYLSLHANLLI